MSDAMKDAQRLADELIGRAGVETLEATMERLGIEDTQEVREEFDQLAFECALCGWWCEAGEANENVNEPGAGDLCDDCAEDEECK